MIVYCLDDSWSIFLETMNYMIHLLEMGIKLFQIERYCSLITLEVFQNNSNSRCFIPSQEHDPWWRAELENRKYIFHIDVINSAEICDEGSSNTAITALVQQTISPPGVHCDSSKTYDARAKYSFHCGVTIPGRFVTISLSGRSLNRLVLCSVDIRALGKWDAASLVSFMAESSSIQATRAQTSCFYNHRLKTKLVIFQLSIVQWHYEVRSTLSRFGECVALIYH